MRRFLKKNIEVGDQRILYYLPPDASIKGITFYPYAVGD